MTPQLRISFTLSGGASLGAYEAGAMAAILVAVQELLERGDDRIRIEALGGASAGALVALFGAHALADGIDPVGLLRTTWVKQFSLDLFRARHGRAPLDFEKMREGLREILAADGSEPKHPPDRATPDHPVTLYVALTGLQGLTYPIAALGRDRELTGVTHADWGQFSLEPGGGPGRLFEPEGRSPLDFVLASAANPGGFAPLILDRSADEEEYRARGIDNFPEEGQLWYTDGSLVQAEPLGRVLAAARRGEAVEEDVRRVNVVMDPRSKCASGSTHWSDPDKVPRWEEGLSRALSILPAQALYDDLRRIEKRNTRLTWSAALVDVLMPHMDADAETALDELLDRIDGDRRPLRKERSTAGERERYPEEPERRRKLRRAVEEVAGLVGKERVAVDVISPRLLSEERGEEVPERLAGEFMGDFGGFLRDELRESDFRLGYESGRIWLERAAAEVGIEPDTRASLLERVVERSPGDWREVDRAGAGVRSLPWRTRLRLARYAAHMGRVLAGALLRR